MSLKNATITLSISGLVAVTGNALLSGDLPVNWQKAIALVAGTTVNKADIMYVVPGNVDSGAAINYDVSGTLKDVAGDNAIMVEMVGFVLSNKADPAASPTAWINGLGHATTGVAGLLSVTTTKVRVGPGGFAAIINPVDPAHPVVAATGDVFQVSADLATPTPYDLFLFGRSA
jgi:hypothetical protein